MARPSYKESAKLDDVGDLNAVDNVFRWASGMKPRGVADAHGER